MNFFTKKLKKAFKSVLEDSVANLHGIPPKTRNALRYKDFKHFKDFSIISIIIFKELNFFRNFYY